MKYKLKLILLIVVLSFHSNTFLGQNNEKHNFLFISVDDFRPEINSYGVKKMITPNIDKLASS